ncbi:cupin [Chloroflexota bacterium]
MEDKFPHRQEKPWGYELLFAHTPDYAGKLIFVKKGHRLSLQYHNKKDESIYIYEGKALLEIGGEGEQLIQSEVSSGYCFQVPPMTRHRLQAIEDTMLFEVSTPELEDVERLDDDYGRV